MTETDYQHRTFTPEQSGTGHHAPTGKMDAAGSAASDTAGAVKEQTREVASEVKAQARSLASDAKHRVVTEAKGQNARFAEGLRHFADELDDMVGDRDDSPARRVMSRVSQGGRRAADYLAEHGPEGVLRDLRNFAGRRPGTFLAVAAATGFVAARLGKGVLGAASVDSHGTARVADNHAQSASVSHVPPTGDAYVQPASAGYVQPAVDGYAGSARPDSDLWDARP
jgi:hypothetical protein